MTANAIQAARDGFEVAGELVTLTDQGAEDKSIWVKITHGVQVIEPDSGASYQSTTIRAIYEDIIGISKAARFIDANGVSYQKKRQLTNDHITTLMTVGESGNV